MDLTRIPKDPGCYIFKDKEGNILYIGKAKSLIKRVRSYFQKKHSDKKTEKLVKNIEKIDYFITDNEVEALILENNLIKKHKPKFNINLKESKRYAYLVLTDEKFPRLIAKRDKKIKGTYFGPFTSGEYRKLLKKLLVNNFSIRTCNKMPKKACLRYHIDLCNAPCIGKISEKNYKENTRKVSEYLEGRTEKLIKKLEKEMKKYSKDLIFENAKIRRDQISALKYLDLKQKVEQEKNYDENVINYVVQNNTVYLIVFNIKKGILTTKNEFSFDYSKGFLEDFLKQYYAVNQVPREILIPEKLEDKSIEKYLKKTSGKKMKFVVPKSGGKKELLDLVKRNVEASFLKQDRMISSLRKELNLNFTPSIIETFDVSHTGGTNVVGSMVRFTNAKPDKSNYRRFKIKSYKGNDDFSGIYEIVYRRYKRLKEGNFELPDLIVIDGGLGQLNSGLKALEDINLKIPIISLAKKFEEVYVPNKSRPIRIKEGSPGLKLLVMGRDEAHRFAIKYHKLLRSKGMKNE